MKKILIIIGTTAAFLLFVFFGLKALFPEREAFRRQKIEEELADEYLAYFENLGADDKTSGLDDQNSGHKTANVLTPNEDDFSDDNYYTRDGVTFTPEYARGYLQCVLEIPKKSVQIRRGVYSGTWEDILFDLDIWMVTAARPDYVLGETRYVIYGHNHTVQDLSFNRLKNVKVGDVFYLTNENGVRNYVVTDVFKMSRSDVRTQLVNNEKIGPDKCYIVTCGRNEMRYYDLVVEGTFKDPD